MNQVLESLLRTTGVDGSYRRRMFAEFDRVRELLLP
jgi:hypothetical protein